MNENANADLPLEYSSFPVFTSEFLKSKFKAPKQQNQAALDLISSLNCYKSQNPEFEVFGNFMEETYDSKDLIFFLYLRSAIEKDFKIKFENLSQAKSKNNNNKIN